MKQNLFTVPLWRLRQLFSHFSFFELGVHIQLHHLFLCILTVMVLRITSEAAYKPDAK